MAVKFKSLPKHNHNKTQHLSYISTEFSKLQRQKQICHFPLGDKRMMMNQQYRNQQGRMLISEPKF